jgi:peptidoglycan/LPS O-acetylase OafA/YrhL
MAIGGVRGFLGLQMTHRIRFLDALRGIAVLTVFLQHCLERMLYFKALHGLTPLVEGIFLAGCNFGRLGVALFFIISGYVVPFSFKGAQPVRGFVISRFFRLYPAYWLSILLMLIVDSVREPERLPSVANLLANITMFQQFLGQEDIIGSYWTLAIELMFYILCALLFAVGLLNRTIPTALAICAMVGGALVVGVASYLTHHHWPANILLNLGFMFLGTMFRRATADHDGMARRLLPILVVMTAVAVPIVQYLSYPVGGEGTDPLVRPFAFTSAYLVALAIFALAVRHWSDRPGALNQLGQISYSWYLFHGAIIFAVEPIMGLPIPASPVLFVLVAAAVTVVVSSLIFRFVEKPAVKAGRNFAGPPARPAESRV